MNPRYDITFTEVIAETESGSLPIEFFDLNSIANINDPETAKITAILKKIQDRIILSNEKLLQEEYKTEYKDFNPQILISVSNTINAFTIPAFKTKPVIVITSELLKKAESEDEIAGVIAHELHHNLQSKRFTTKIHGQIEECACDGLAVKMLRNAKYAASGYAEFFKRTPDKMEGFSQLFDSHPANTTRVMQIDNAELALDQAAGKPQHIKLTSNPLAKQNFKLPYTQLYHETVIQNPQLKILNKLDYMKEIFSMIKKGNFDCYNEWYTCDFLDALHIEAIENKPSIPAQQNQAYFDLLHDMRNWLLNENKWLTKDANRNTTQRKLFVWIQKQMSNNLLHHTDKLYQLKENFIKFVMLTQSKEQSDSILKDCRHLANDIINSLNLNYSTRSAVAYIEQEFSKDDYYYNDEHFMRSYRFKPLRYANPSPEEIDKLNETSFIEPSWNKAVLLGLEEQKVENSSNILNVLYLVGIQSDPRVLSQKDKFQCKNALLAPLAKHNDLTIDHDGHIINPLAAPRQVREERLLKLIDWKQLETKGLKAFIGEHKDYLLIEYKPERDEKCKTNYIFTQRLLEEILKLPDNIQEKIAKENEMEYLLHTAAQGTVPRKHDEDIESRRISILHPLVQFLLHSSKQAKLFKDRKKSRDSFLYNHVKIYDHSSYKGLLLDPMDDFDIAEIKSINDIKKYHANSDIRDLNLLLLLHYIQQWSSHYIPPDEFIWINLTAKMELYPSELAKRVISNIHIYAVSYIKNLIESKEEKIDQFKQGIEIYFVLSLRTNSQYNYYSHDNSFFSENKTEQTKLLEFIIKHYKTCKLSNAEKLELLQKILFTHASEEYKSVKADKQAKYIADFPDVGMENDILNFYADELAESCKQFDTSDSEKQLKEIIDRIFENTSLLHAKRILETFAEKIQAQQNIAYYIRDKLHHKTENAAKEKYIFGEVGYRILNYARDDKQKCDAIIKFLLNPVTEETSKKLNQEIRVFDKFDKNEIEKYRLFHKNFWLKSPVERAYVFQQLVYTNRSEKYGEILSNEQMRLRAKKEILDIVFPVPHHTKVKVISEERKIIEAYLKACTEAEESALLSMLLAAQAPGEQHKVRQQGQILKIILENMGPAGTKLAQAINSHPDTPENIRKDMAQSKFMADKPNRWNMYEQLNACYDKMDEIASVGSILGAGAYGVAVKVTKKNGDETVITLLRQHAYNRALTQFNTLEQAAKNLVDKDKKYKPVIAMVQQAKSASEDETNMALADEQNYIAERLYNNIDIRIGEGDTQVVYSFFTPQWIGYGANYKETAIVPGCHFMDLPNESKEDKVIRNHVAIAILTIELKNFVAGFEFETDRHGAQQRIFGKYIGQFDFGGVTLQPPTKEEKQLMGEILGHVLKDFEKGTNLIDSLHEAIQASSSSNKEFLAKIERAVLALSDYMPYITKSDMTSILASIRKYMDPIIEKSLSYKLVDIFAPINFFYSREAIKTLDTKLKASQSVKIEIVETKPRPAPRALATLEIKQDASVNLLAPTLNLIFRGQGRSPVKGQGAEMAIALTLSATLLHWDNNAFQSIINHSEKAHLALGEAVQTGVLLHQELKPGPVDNLLSQIKEEKKNYANTKDLSLVQQQTLSLNEHSLHKNLEQAFSELLTKHNDTPWIKADDFVCVLKHKAIALTILNRDNQFYLCHPAHTLTTSSLTAYRSLEALSAAILNVWPQPIMVQCSFLSTVQRLENTLAVTPQQTHADRINETKKAIREYIKLTQQPTKVYETKKRGNKRAYAYDSLVKAVHTEAETNIILLAILLNNNTKELRYSVAINLGFNTGNNTLDIEDATKYLQKLITSEYKESMKYIIQNIIKPINIHAENGIMTTNAVYQPILAKLTQLEKITKESTLSLGK